MSRRGVRSNSQLSRRGVRSNSQLSRRGVRSNSQLSRRGVLGREFSFCVEALVLLSLLFCFCFFTRLSILLAF